MPVKKDQPAGTGPGKARPAADQNPTQRRTVPPKEREFLFQAFHDMRNPLHTIMGYTQRVLRKTQGMLPVEERENLEKVLISAEKLREIVERLITRYHRG